MKLEREIAKITNNAVKRILLIKLINNIFSGLEVSLHRAVPSSRALRTINAVRPVWFAGAKVRQSQNPTKPFKHL